MLCKDLPAVKQSRDKETYLLERLCVIGTLGDLGATSQFDHLWSKDDIQACIKKFGKKTLTDVVSLVNARMLFFSLFIFLLIFVFQPVERQDTM